ncbi:MAG: DUF4381 domain-containing protein [Gammaproteobacteria bacterium]|nr:MAG: DUF4381 domain-containing protein [Gammaproteobacteria bacterium]
MAFSPDSLPLRDIHLPAETLTSPLLPGGLGLLAALAALAALLGLAVLGWRRRDRRAPARAALAAIERQRAAAPTDPAWLIGLSELLRRTALARYPRAEVAGLTGEQWRAFLAAEGGAPGFAAAPGRWLVEGPYREQVSVPEAEAAALLAAARRWLEARPRGAPC